MFKTLSIPLVFLLCFNINVLLSYRLNVPKVLLPYFSSIPVNFTLEISDPNSIDGSGGCFKWKSSRPEIVSIISGNVCSDRVIVSAISPHRQKLTAVVYSEDTLSGLTLRCDVMVDVINEIEIITTTRELFLEDAPEMFLVRAKNDQDDTFSTLDGLIFDWHLEQTDKILKFVQFSDSKYETTTAIQRLEDVGRRGHQVLVEGVDTGRASLSVQLKDDAYKNVNSHKINLAVVAHLMLNPSTDLYLPVGVKVRYQVQLIKQSRVEIVAMPSPQYYLSLSDDNICSLDEMTSIVTSRRIGTTEILLKHKNEDLAATLRMPSAFIRVVDPVSLKFVVQPGHNWVLEVGKTYEIYLNLYDTEKHQLFVTEDMRLRATLPEEYFETVSQTKNASYFNAKPIKKGKTELIGEYETLKTRQQVEIFDPLIVKPDLAVFPFDHSGKTYHMSLKVQGGSGSFAWSSDNRQVAIISEQTGNVVAGMNRGSAMITATDLRNRLHSANMRVVVVDVTSFEIGEGQREFELGSIVRLPIVAYADVSFSPVRRVQIANCSHLKMKVRSNDPEMFEFVDASTVDDTTRRGCAFIHLLAKKIGDTEITISLNRNDLPPLESSLTLSVFEPLKVIDPQSADLLLAPGSSWVIKYSGGPRPWLLDANGYFAKVKNDVDDSIQINWPTKRRPDEILTSAIETFITFCKNSAQTDIILSVGNEKSASNRFPVVATKKIKIVCDAPDKITLLPVLHEPAGFPPCPLTKTSHTIPVHFQNPTKLRLIAFDKSQRKFDNISSLVPVWHAEDDSFVEIFKKISLLESTESYLDGKTVLESSYTTKPLGKIGTTSFTVEIKSFSLSDCVEQKCLKSLSHPLTTSINLVLTDYLKVEPEFLSLFNHPSNKMNLQIANGSGYFYSPLTEGDKELASVNLVDNKIEIKPKNDGQFALNVFDLCLNVERPSVSDIYISSIAKIQLIGAEMVEIQKEIVVNIILLDRNDREMIGNFLHLLDLRIIIDNSVVSVRLINGQQNCIVRGLKVGVGSFVVTVSQNNEPKIVRSNNHIVQVFSPLELRPKRVTLITGAKFQLEILGGPQTSGILSFVLNDTNIASVREDGLIEAFKLGHVLITGHVMGSRGLSSHVEDLGEDSVLLEVVSLTGIKIRVPSLTVYRDTEMNVHVVGLSPKNTPMSWGSIEHSLLFEWSVDDENAAAMGFIHDVNGLSEPSLNQFARRVSCLKVGLVTIKVKVTAHARSKNHFLHGSKIFSDSVQLRVLEPLQITSPPRIDPVNFLIITPNTGIQLKLNSNGAVVHYVSHPPHLVSIDADGYLQTFEQTGQGSIFISVAGRVLEVNETLTLNVLVEPVHHIQLNAVSKFRLKDNIFHLPVGYTMDYLVSAHDMFGRTFHASNLVLKFRPNRFDLTDITVQYTNRSLSVNLKHVGETILNVFDTLNSKQLVDYIRITAGVALKPNQKTLVVGDIVCFETFVSEDTFVRNRWLSGKRNVIDILPVDGIAAAASVGETTISHSIDSKLTSNINLHVVEPWRIEFLTWKSPKIVGTFNLDLQESTELPFLIKYNFNQTSNLHGEHCARRLKTLKDSSATLKHWLFNPPFTCQLYFEDQSVDAYQLLSVTAIFSVEAASYVCSIKPLSSSDVVSQYSRFESPLIVTAASGSNKLSDTIRIPYYSPFVVQSNELRFDNLHNSVQILNVIASPTQENYLKVISNMEQVVEISTRTRKDFQGGDVTFEYSVELLVDSANVWQKDLSGLHLTILSELTKQQVNVPLIVKLFGSTPKGVFVGGKPSTVWGFLEMLIENYGSAILVLITIIVTIAAMYFGYRAVYNGSDMPPSAQFSQTNSPTGVSPNVIQWKTFGKQSPGGKQIAGPTQQYPYLWSMSRSQTPPEVSSPNYSFR